MARDPDSDFAALKEAVLRLRRMADQQESLLPLEAELGLLERQQHFVRGAIALLRMAAATLDQAIEVHRQTVADFGYDMPPPRAKLRAIQGGAPEPDDAA